MPTWILHTEFKFDAAHYIDGYNGKCGRMHGHTYKVHMKAKSNKLNPSAYLGNSDMVCDFKELKWAAKDSKKGNFYSSDGIQQSNNIGPDKSNPEKIELDNEYFTL